MRCGKDIDPTMRMKKAVNCTNLSWDFGFLGGLYEYEEGRVIYYNEINITFQGRIVYN